jgi:hypothetical protein
MVKTRAVAQRVLSGAPAERPLEAPLSIPVYNCSTFPANITNPGAVGNASCPCASCLEMCPVDHSPFDL